MTYYSVSQPYEVFFDDNGDPLEDGYIYIGEVNENPITNPINVYWDAAGLYPAAQPIRTIAGYASRNGSPGNLYVNLNDQNDYSILIQNKNQKFIYADYSVLSEGGITITGTLNLIDDLRGVTSGSRPIYVRWHTAIGDGGGGTFEFISGAAPGTYVDDNGVTIVPAGGDGSAAWIRQYSFEVSVKWFGVTGDGVTDDTTAFQAAIDFCTDPTIDATFLQNYRAGEYDAPIGRKLFIPKGQYLLSQELLIQGIIDFEGEGSHQTVFIKTAGFTSTYNAMIVISREDDDELWILGGRFKGFKVNGDDETVAGIYQWRHHFFKFEDVICSECLQGIRNIGCYTGKYDQCQFYANNIGFKAELNDPFGAIYEEPNNIDFISCIMLENTNGWNLGSATNFNFIGGLTQGQENEGLTLNGDTGSINFEGHYFEVNATGGGYQISTPFAVRSLRVEGGQISTTYPFLDAEKALEVKIENNNILGAGTVVYISATSTIRNLVYQNNPRIFSTALTSYVIDNNLSDFVPEMLYYSDFNTSAGSPYNAIGQIKQAMNGTKGIFGFLENTDTPISIDFPCTMTSIGRSKNIGISRGGTNAVTVLSDNVDIEDMLVAVTGGFYPITIGDGVSTYENISVRRCRLVTGSATNGCINSLFHADFVDISDNEFERLTSAGRGATIDGDKCLAYRAFRSGSYACNIVFGANSTNCRWALIYDTPTDTGTGNSSF